MKAFLITMSCLYGLGVLINMARLGSARPWPRKGEYTPPAIVIALAINAGLLAWSMYLLNS